MPDDIDNAIPDYARGTATGGGTSVVRGKAKSSVTATVRIHHMTVRGIKVSTMSGDGTEFWLPISQIEMPDNVTPGDEGIDINMPDWLAKQHGIS